MVSPEEYLEKGGVSVHSTIYRLCSGCSVREDPTALVQCELFQTRATIYHQSVAVTLSHTPPHDKPLEITIPPHVIVEETIKGGFLGQHPRREYDVTCIQGSQHRIADKGTMHISASFQFPHHP